MKSFHGLGASMVDDLKTRHILGRVERALHDLYTTVFPVTKGTAPLASQPPLGAIITHADLKALATSTDGNVADDHPQYLALTGRPGTQAIISSDPTHPALIIRAAPGQSSDILQITDSTGAIVYSTVNSAGAINSTSPSLIGLSTLTSAATSTHTNTIPDKNGTFAMTSDIPSAVYNSGTAFAGSTAAIGNFTAFVTTHAGFYRLSAYVVDIATTTAGVVTTRVTYVDNSGTQSNITLTSTNLTGVGINSFSPPIIVYCTNGSGINFNTTIGTFSGTYDCYFAIEAL